jgi:hypothetical protein
LVDFAIYAPYLISIAITLAYASLGKLSSGEAFDEKKFAETLAVQFTALLAVGLVGYPETTALLPTLITVLVMKLISYLKKQGLI